MSTFSTTIFKRACQSLRASLLYGTKYFHKVVWQHAQGAVDSLASDHSTANLPRESASKRTQTAFSIKVGKNYSMCHLTPSLNQNLFTNSQLSTLWSYDLMALYKTVYYYYFLNPGTQFPENEKITLFNTEKYKNQAGMNLTPPSPSQNSREVRWHCTAESERRVAKIKS